MKLRKFFSTAIALVLCAGVLSACSIPEEFEEEQYTGADNELLVWSVDPLVGNYQTVLATNPTDPDALLTKSVIEGFQQATVSEEYPQGIRVVIQNHGWGTDLSQALDTAIGSDTMPDITVGEQFVKTYINNNHFLPIEMDETLVNDFVDEAQSVIFKGDKIYAVPFLTGSFVLNINKAALADFGILNSDYTVNQDWQSEHPDWNPLAPETWEELLGICEYIHGLNGQQVNGKTLNGVGGMLMNATEEDSSWRALVFMRTAGGDIGTSDGTVTMDTPENKKAFEMMRAFVATAPSRSINSSTTNEMWNTFLFNDRAAYTIDGNDILTNAEVLGRRDDFAVAEIPTYEENGIRANVMVGTGYYSISNQTDKYDLCVEFLEYILQPEIQRDFMEATNRLSARKSVLDSQEVTELSNYADLQVFMKPFQDDTYEFEGGLPTFDNRPADVWDQWNTFITDLLRTDKELSGIMRTAQSEMSRAASGR